MSNIDLDDLLAESYLESGVKPSVVAKRTGKAGAKRVAALGGFSAAGKRRAPEWNAEDIAFIRNNCGVLHDTQIAEALGRTATAVKVRRKRLGLPTLTKAPQNLTAMGVGRALGAEVHTVCHWIDTGLLPGRLMPGPRQIRLVERVTLYRWAVNPNNWPLFKPERVTDPKLKRLIALRAARWGDEWWTTKRAAEYFGVTPKDVLRKITIMHQLSGMQVVNISGRHSTPGWSSWFLKRSEVLAANLVFNRGKGSNAFTEFSPGQREFVMLARGIGLPYPNIAKLVGWKVRDTAQRVQSIGRRFGGIPFIDWREHRQRFPFVVNAVQRWEMGMGKDLSPDELNALAGIMRAWSARFGLGINISNSHLSVRVIDKKHMAFIDAGFDPFDMVNE